jgi:hypothetical protein
MSMELSIYIPFSVLTFMDANKMLVEDVGKISFAA